MGKLTEIEQWDEDVYQIETSDPVLGGPEGITNKPAKQLANRTQWLKKRLEEAGNALAEHAKSRNHPDATLINKGFVKLYSGVTSLDETMAATPKAVKIAMDNANARLAKERNLADLANIPLARQSLELGNSATLNVGTTVNTVAAGNDSRITGAMQKDQNLADVPDKVKARAALQLGNSATRNVGTTINTVAAGDDARILAAKKAIDDTQTGLAAQGVMWISTADDLTNLPSGARRFASNKAPATVLPSAGYFFLEVLARRDSARGSCILATSDAGNVWIGLRYTVPADANFTWIQLNQNVENLGLEETINLAAGALQKDQNGGDIPDKGLFAQNIGAALAFSGGVSIGEDSSPWTTADFIAWLESHGAFNHPYWMCRGSWSYADNRIITDTGCGNICLAGAVVEVMGTGGAITIRVTTPTTTSGGGVPSTQFIYINNGDGYAPGWRREFSRTGDEMTGSLTLRSDDRMHFMIANADGSVRAYIYKDKDDTGIHINNGVDGYGNFTFGKDGILYVPFAVRAGDSRKIAIQSENNSALNATFNLWGNANRPAVIELDDDQGWHLYSQRNTDGSVVFYVNGDIHANTLSAGAAIYANNGDVFGTAWGGGNAAWLSSYLYSNMVKAVRLGPVALSGGLWRDFQLGGGQVVTGFHTDGDWEMQGGDDKVYYRPIQYLIGIQWVTAPSV